MLSIILLTTGAMLAGYVLPELLNVLSSKAKNVPVGMNLVTSLAAGLITLGVLL